MDFGLRPLIRGHPWCVLVIVKHTWADSGSAAGSWRQNHLPKLGVGGGGGVGNGEVGSLCFAGEVFYGIDATWEKEQVPSPSSSLPVSAY